MEWTGEWMARKALRTSTSTSSTGDQATNAGLGKGGVSMRALVAMERGGAHWGRLTAHDRNRDALLQ